MALPALLRDNLSIPVVGAPLFIVSNPDLVIEQCKAGIVGSFPALNARPKESARGVAAAHHRRAGASTRPSIPDKKVAPFAVNQIVHSSNDRLQHDIDLCEKYKVPIQITSLRAPDDVVDVGAPLRLPGVPRRDQRDARQARAAGRRRRPRSWSAPAPAAMPAACRRSRWCRKCASSTTALILLSGSISNGASVLAAQAMGADLAYLGTRFTASKEGNATDGQQAVHHRFERRGDRLHQPLHRRARQLHEARPSPPPASIPTRCRKPTRAR